MDQVTIRPSGQKQAVPREYIPPKHMTWKLCKVEDD
jgi:hypothetical protein